MRGVWLPDAMAAMSPPLTALVAMWWLMMVAMMLPSAAPAILLYGRVREQRSARDRSSSRGFFSPAISQSGCCYRSSPLPRSGIAPEMLPLDRRVAGGVLIAAGLYQLSPLKRACLKPMPLAGGVPEPQLATRCSGGHTARILHGTYCVGCCWMLMALLFVGGVMNFAWIAALTLIVGIEKLVPRGDLVGRVVGVALVGWAAIRIMH